MRPRLARHVLAAIVALAGCHSSNPNQPLTDGGEPADAPGTVDGMPADAPALDAPADASTPLPSGCGSDATLVSGFTRPEMGSPLVAYNGTVTMVAWTVFTGIYQRHAWAELQSGAVVASGDFDLSVQPAQLFAFRGTFYAFSTNVTGRELVAFDGTAWTAIPAFANASVVVPGDAAIAAVVPPLNTGVNVITYDGTTASAPAHLSDYTFGALAADGSGGFGVLTVQPASEQYALRLVTYNGTTWSAESTIGTSDYFNVAVTNWQLAHAGTMWAVAYGPPSFDASAWVQSGGTWSTTELANMTQPRLTANAAGTFALASAQAVTQVYSDGTWTEEDLPCGTLVPFLTGYACLHATGSEIDGTIYDGASWGSAAAIAPVGAAFTTVASGDTIAVGFAPGSAAPEVATYDAGAWSAPVVLSTAVSTGPVLAVEGSDVVAVYPEPGAMTSRTRAGGTWAAALALPASPSPGETVLGAIARTADGHVLAAWTQRDLDQLPVLAAEYDGSAWSSPVELTGLGSGTPFVAAAGSTFIVGASSPGLAGAWTGSGVTTPAALGSGARVASDGTTFVAAWIDGSGDLVSATSSDGQSWTMPATVDTGPGWTLEGLVGGPGGVLAWVSNAAATPNASARLWSGGAWSMATALDAEIPVGTSAVDCKGAVAATTALIACNGSATLDAEEIAGGTWTDVPLGPSIEDTFSLGTDGADYRLDYFTATPVMASALLHDGAWSSPLPDPDSLIEFPSFTEGTAVGWTAIGVGASPLAAAHATGSGAYASPVALVPGADDPTTVGASAWPGQSDAFWMISTAQSQGVPVLCIDLGL